VQADLAVQKAKPINMMGGYQKEQMKNEKHATVNRKPPAVSDCVLRVFHFSFIRWRCRDPVATRGRRHVWVRKQQGPG
jgi:hypothetical protein